MSSIHTKRSTSPESQLVELPGRGTTLVRDIPGPPAAPTLVLLHGWTATADLNWRTSYEALSRHFRIIALDHRGHGRGLRSSAPFSLEDCADDVAALLDVLDLPQVIVAGYSMGGPIAQLLWRRHPSLVAGVVLCATSDHFVETPVERLLRPLSSIATSISRHLPRDRWIRLAKNTARHRSHEHGALLELTIKAVEDHDWTAIFEAGMALSDFDSRSWIEDLDVPTAVVMTTEDRVVPSARQLRLGAAIPGATLHTVRGDHDVCINKPGRFVHALREACLNVAARVAEPMALAA